MVLRQPGPKLVLSMTPLIDVVFILLIFFMLVSQFADWHQIDLMPQAHLSGAVSAHNAQSLQMLNDGSFMLNGQPVEDLQAMFAQLISVAQDITVFLSPEDAVKIQSVVDIVDALNEAGISDVQLSEARNIGLP